MAAIWALVWPCLRASATASAGVGAFYVLVGEDAVRAACTDGATSHENVASRKVLTRPASFLSAPPTPPASAARKARCTDETLEEANIVMVVGHSRAMGERGGTHWGRAVSR